MTIIKRIYIEERIGEIFRRIESKTLNEHLHLILIQININSRKQNENPPIT